MPNIHVGTSSADVPSRAGVGTTSQVVIAENINRVGLVVTNLSDQTIYIGIGNTSTLNAGIVLTGGGGAWSMDDYTYSKEAITAIGNAATLTIAFQEFILRP